MQVFTGISFSFIIWIQLCCISSCEGALNLLSHAPKQHHFSNIHRDVLPFHNNAKLKRENHMVVSNNDIVDGTNTFNGKNKNYFLLTPNVWVKTILPTTLILMALRSFVAQLHFASSNVLVKLSGHCHPNGSILQHFMVKNLLLPSLASSCCLIQLIINFVTGIGCVGFNSILGPIRPWVVSVQLFFTILSISVGELNLLSLSMSWILTFTPEIIAFLNYKKQIVSNQQFEAATDYSDVKPVIVDLSVEDMGCVACINKIESTVANSFPTNLLRIESWLNDTKKGGQVRLFINSFNGDEEEVTNQVISLIQKAGFSCHKY